MKINGVPVTHEGVIYGFNDWPGKWFRTQEGNYYVLLSIKSQKPKFRAVEVHNPQNLEVVRGILVERKWFGGE